VQRRAKKEEWREGEGGGGGGSGGGEGGAKGGGRGGRRCTRVRVIDRCGGARRMQLQRDEPPVSAAISSLPLAPTRFLSSAAPPSPPPLPAPRRYSRVCVRGLSYLPRTFVVVWMTAAALSSIMSGRRSSVFAERFLPRPRVFQANRGFLQRHVSIAISRIIGSSRRAPAHGADGRRRASARRRRARG